MQNIRSSNRQKRILQVAWLLLWLAGPAWSAGSVGPAGWNRTVSWGSGPALALSIEQLNPEREWRVSTLLLSGNQVFEEKTLLAELRTHSRPWYLLWKERPVFDPVTFETDLKGLQHYYKTQGYYQTIITYELQTDDRTALVTIAIQIVENGPVTVEAVTVELTSEAAQQGGSPLSELSASMPLKSGAIFTEAAYTQTEHALRQIFLQRGQAWVEIQRKAEVNLNTQHARVTYTIQPGPKTTFDKTDVTGTQHVAKQLVLRELAYHSGEQFSLQQIEDTRKSLLDLDLFRSVSVELQHAQQKPREIPIRVRVEEKEPRSVRLGVGYSTEEEFTGHAAWLHRNWLDGGRRLSFALRLSSIQRSLGATFVQPYFLTHANTLQIDVQQGQEDEESYLLNYSRFRPRIERHFLPTLTGFAGYRLEFLKFNEVASSTIQTLGGIRREGVLSGPSLGLVWDTTEDPLNPTQGGIVSLFANQAGKVWGGDYEFFSLTAEAKRYQRIGWGVVMASRLEIGLSDTFGSRKNLPLSERFYAGGAGSVRGYSRRKLGPLNRADDPLGGLSLVEGSVELRRPVWRNLSGAIFFDFGQLSLDAYDLPFDDLQFSPGFGVSYATPIGPLRLDIGFPINPAEDDDPWQVHFSIGQYF